MRILITGCAGFIGMHTALRFLERKEEVIGVDSLNNYYDVRLKKLAWHNLPLALILNFIHLI